MAVTAALIPRPLGKSRSKFYPRQKPDPATRALHSRSIRAANLREPLPAYGKGDRGALLPNLRVRLQSKLSRQIRRRAKRPFGRIVAHLAQRIDATRSDPRAPLVRNPGRTRRVEAAARLQQSRNRRRNVFV